jgi:ribonuclease HII
MQINLGLDQAGRGSVIGSMFICGAIIDNQYITDLEHFKDSKCYSNTKIQKLYNYQIKDKFKYQVIQIKPKQIDKYNLTDIECKYFAKIINHFNPDFVFVDCPSSNILRFESDLLELLTCKPVIYCDHKMDVTSKVTSLASIIAKRYRQKHVKDLNKSYDIQIGSGYPSDPKTRSFIKSYPNFEWIRKKWNLKSD